MNTQFEYKGKKITYKLGIGHAEYTCPTPQSRDIIIDFLQSMKRQGAIGFWEKQLIDAQEAK
jgi:hypothetical protein